MAEGGLAGQRWWFQTLSDSPCPSCCPSGTSEGPRGPWCSCRLTSHTQRRRVGVPRRPALRSLTGLPLRARLSLLLLSRPCGRWRWCLSGVLVCWHHLSRGGHLGPSVGSRGLGPRPLVSERFLVFWHKPPRPAFCFSCLRSRLIPLRSPGSFLWGGI